MKQKRMTLEQIAREINISRVTISKVINGHDSVSLKNKQIVLDALKAYGYRENKAAKSLAANRSYTIGLICFDSPRSPYFLKTILQGVREAENQYRDYGLNLDVQITHISSPEEQLVHLDAMSASVYDAIALIPNDIYKPTVTRQIASRVSRITDSGIPVLMVNRDIPNATATGYIGSDYLQSGRMAAEMMVKMLHGGDLLIAVTGAYNHFIDISSRLSGIREVLSLHPEISLQPYYSYAGDHQHFIEHVNRFKDGCEGPCGLIDISYQTGHVIDSINATGKHLYTIGFDQYAQFDQDLKKGFIDAVVSQDMFAQGYYSISHLFQLVSGQIEQIPSVPIKNELILAANCEAYM